MKQPKHIAIFLVLGCMLVFVASCTSDGSSSNNPQTTTSPKVEQPKINYPNFDANNAYNMIQKQVDFGTRVPGTAPHKACAEWLESTLKAQADEVMVQTAEVTAFNGAKLPMYNVIASFNPQSSKRIMLSAHWDTRPFADHDDDEARKDEPIIGANDGGSGTGILLEIAKVLKANPLKNIGVDIFLWDVEDYGKGSGDTYCLGSQYWSKNKHKSGYKAQYGILLDMVGARNAVFQQEGHSKQFAQHILDKVWAAGHKGGYSGFFPFKNVAPITDDHYYINTLAGIPTIDIIQYDQYTGKGFFPQWHTHDDDMSIIDKNTLKAVGQTVVRVLYDEDAGK